MSGQTQTPTPQHSPSTSIDATPPTATTVVTPHDGQQPNPDPLAGPLTVGVNAPGGAERRCSTKAISVKSDEHGFRYSFEEHRVVKMFLETFAVVELVACEVYVRQATVFGASTTKGTPTFLCRFGVTPRDALPTTKTDNTGDNVVSSIPHLSELTLGTNVASQGCVKWGRGGVPFPPGLQTDLKAAEIRFKKPNVFAGITTPVAATNDAPAYDLVAVNINFVISGSGQGFGASFPMSE